MNDFTVKQNEETGHWDLWYKNSKVVANESYQMVSEIADPIIYSESWEIQQFIIRNYEYYRKLNI